MKLGPKQARKLIQPHPVSVVTTVNEEGIPDATTFSWTCPVSSDPPLLAIMVSPQRYTFKNLDVGREFVVNIVTKHSLKELAYVGKETFEEDPQKLEKSGFTTVEAEGVNPPGLEEAVAWAECRVKERHEAGDHWFVIGEILGGRVDDEFWDDENGGLLVEKAEILHHLGGERFLVAGKVIECGE